ncbi:hypothetical protein A2572_04710 [Candidatus Collierbacteria bacterium RIFOXYD1_FULL_40_9]|uniref:DUF5671 domain-containing protein n=1 Tax=Candidatus Collierbacteria bacterium RIFOXYD1_FULL_40_9 TaxID=1817731 RepID=A0A1F5FT90_9BACT|nr:MAG: hypothetical protein A2572_04710 [Candidatus Collierbacteria bacterium RIFOXYD1_FULL_40_9]
MNWLALNLVFVLIYGALAVLYLVTTVCNWIFVDCRDWNVEEGKNWWEDIKFALLVAFPVLNFGILVTTIYYWYVPRTNP